MYTTYCNHPVILFQFLNEFLLVFLFFLLRPDHKEIKNYDDPTKKEDISPKRILCLQ